MLDVVGRHELLWTIRKNHCVRTFANKIFELSVLPRSQTSCTKADAEPLKRNFAYFIHMYHGERFEKFQWHAKAVMEHHFNNHEFCDKWCPGKNGRKKTKSESSSGITKRK